MLGSIVAGLVTLLNRVFDSRDFRRDTEKTIGSLQARDDAQENRINRLLGRIVDLESQVTERERLLVTQRQLKDDCRNRLHSACMCIQLYRKSHGQHDDDSLDMGEWIKIESLKEHP